MSNFDHVASGYDSVAESKLGIELRRRVHQVLHGLTAPGLRVVDLGCGSGIDAAWLAPQVGNVLGFDSSAEMVALARQRCAAFSNVSIEREDVGSLVIDEPADIVLANFGVINCVGDLTEFRPRLEAMLKPRSQAVLVSMPRWCPIELGIGIAQRNPELRDRRRPGGPKDPRYVNLDVTYASTRDIRRAFESSFRVTHAESLGVVLPPFEQRHMVEDRDGLRMNLARLDRMVSTLGAKAGVGDHHIVVLERTS